MNSLTTRDAPLERSLLVFLALRLPRERLLELFGRVDDLRACFLELTQVGGGRWGDSCGGEANQSRRSRQLGEDSEGRTCMQRGEGRLDGRELAFEGSDALRWRSWAGQRACFWRAEEEAQTLSASFVSSGGSPSSCSCLSIWRRPIAVRTIARSGSLGRRKRAHLLNLASQLLVPGLAGQHFGIGLRAVLACGCRWGLDDVHGR